MALDRISAATPPIPAAAPPALKAAAAPAPALTAASLQFSSSIQREQADDPTAILQDWKDHRGGLYESGFLGIGKKNLSVGDALKNLNKGDDVYVKNRFGDYDKLKSIDDLFLLNTVDGTFGDYHRADPSLRLPLLFLGGQKVTTDNTKDKISSYEAYKRMQGNKTIKVNDQALNPADLARKVIASYIPADADPGQALKNSVGISGNDGGWKVDGRDVSGDVLYLALLKGANRLTFNGTMVGGKDGVALVNFLQHGREQEKLPPQIAAAAGEFRAHASHLPALNRDAYGAFSALLSNQPVRAGNDTVRSLTELSILNALQGDRQPTPALPAELQDALLALGDGGLSTGGPFAAYQSLAAGNPISYTFNGGPANEPITLTIPSLAAAPAIHQQVDAQRDRDRFRPDLDDFKRLMADKGAASSAILEGELSASRSARESAQSDIPRQQDAGRAAQARYDDNARRLQDVNARIGPAQDEERRAAGRLEDARSSYDRKRAEVEDLTWRYNQQAQEVERLNREAAEEDRAAEREDQLANQAVPPPPPAAPEGGNRPTPPSVDPRPGNGNGGRPTPPGVDPRPGHGGGDNGPRPTPPNVDPNPGHGGHDPRPTPPAVDPKPTPPAGNNDEREQHKRLAAEHRRKAQELRQQATRQEQPLQQIRWQLDGVRREMERRQQDLYQAQGSYDGALRYLQAFQNEANGYQGQMSAARQDMDAADAAISRDQRTIQDADTIAGIGGTMQASLKDLLGTIRGLKEFKDFQANRAALTGDLQQLATLADNGTFTGIHGASLANSLVPVRTVLASMDKPALPPAKSQRNR